MADLETIDTMHGLEQARLAYAEIYRWHIVKGRQEITQRFGNVEHLANYRSGYFALLAELIEPREASADEMLNIAYQSLSGSMEWAYVEQTEHGIPLNQLARRIQDSLQRHEKDEILPESAKFSEMPQSLPPKWDALFGQRVEVAVRSGEHWSFDVYLAHARVAYNSIPAAEGLGGKVFLMQTNLEHTGSKTGSYTFFSAHSLHAEAVIQEGSLSDLISGGVLTVESVILGG